jgi:pre-60S factor REI1
LPLESPAVTSFQQSVSQAVSQSAIIIMSLSSAAESSSSSLLAAAAAAAAAVEPVVDYYAPVVEKGAVVGAVDGSFFTSTTAPGVVFTSRAALAQHYQSDWHAYNLKRRQAGLPFLFHDDFQARLAAAQALRAEKERAANMAGQAHLKHKKPNQQQKHKNASKKKDKDGAVVVMVSQRNAAYDSRKEQKETAAAAETASTTDILQQKEEGDDDDDDDTMNVVDTAASTTASTAATIKAHVPPVEDASEGEEKDAQEAAAEAELEMIDPCQSLFDRHVSASVAENIQYMHEKYGFFIPDAEYLYDPEGLIGYSHEKISLGKQCLYCHKQFHPATTRASAIQAHMRDAQHCKLRYESGMDLEDLLVFYDFEAANQEFLSKTAGRNSSGKAAAAAAQRNDMEEEVPGMASGDEEEEDGWEDVSDNEVDGQDAKMEEKEDDDDDYSVLLQQQVQNMGWNVTELGELVFPDGRIIGHRALRRYYKQRPSSLSGSRQDSSSQTAAVAAARLASRERLVFGRVVQLPDTARTGSSSGGGGASNTTSAMVASSRRLAALGIPASMAMGRGGQGILVPTTTSNNNNNNGNNASSFTQLSLYRFRAVLRQQKRDEMRAMKLHNRTAQNMNRMDKKANRLMNNVSVAHAKR